MVFVANRRVNSVFRAQIAHKDGDAEGIGFVACHLHESGRAEPLAFFVLEVAEEFHLEEAAGLRAGHPWFAASPPPRAGEHAELVVKALQTVLRHAVEPVMEDSRHRLVSLRVRTAVLPRFAPAA